MTIRPAIKEDCAVLTEISFSSKNHWNYPSEYFEIWKNELTITSEYVAENYVQIIENIDEKIGYYSIIKLSEDLKITNFIMEKGIWLEHLFIKPKYIGHGYGKKLMLHLICEAKAKNWKNIKILADPNSKKFYIKMGARYIKEVPSNIPGRTVSYFEWKIENS